ncbi:hypothetical protein [Pectobacterium versatile]|uniref:hypothetical protein n=1 Tax=Pectobacterium versatile TaxID=2488639 RepID=UPI00102EAB05|nr:hypothetical protein [Pectobacterium versatile]TAI83740.1 hypothetical protein EG330_13295 [Pectobacterium versatile]
MQCIGITKKKNRCKNNTKFLFCKKHVWQPVSGFILLISLLGFSAGFFQDLLSPIIEENKRNSDLKKLISIEIKNNRREVAEWQDDTDPMLGKSDVLTILSDRQPVKSLEIYHTAKDQKFKNYPPTAPLADFFIPTEVEYQVSDLDNDGINEIIIILRNRIYSLHYDKQVNVLIYNAKGEMLSQTPYPRDLPDLPLNVHNPYSAYKTTVVMKDKISDSSHSSTFSNDFKIVTKNHEKYLQFSWVIDNASYASPHLHQVEEFRYDGGKLIPIDDTPKLYINDSWENATTGEPVESIYQASDFLKENNLPTLYEVYKELKDVHLNSKK